MITRRAFLKYTGGTALTLFAFNKFGVPKAIAQIPGGTLDPASILKYAAPLVIPPAMPISAINGGFDYYEIAVQQFRQQILPTGLPMTTVWSYGSVNHSGTFNYPAFTIEAKFDIPVRVKWINGLVDSSGKFLSHLLPVDPTLHWANPPGGTGGRDMHPDFTGKTYVPLAEFTNPSTEYTQYTGPVPIVTHLHGGHTTEESDGYAEAWYVPTANNIPAGFATGGSFYKPSSGSLRINTV